MSKALLIPLWISLVFLLASPEAQAQKPKDKRSSGVSEYLEDKGNFASHLWYGGSFNLGFNGNSYYSLFNIGISPMVGYKIIDPISIGPRVSFQYTFIKGIGTDNNIHKVQPLAYSVAAFSRFKFLRSFFAHLEYEYESEELPYFSGPYLYYDAAQAKIATVRVNRDNLYIGAGYNTSGGQGGFGYEILLLYNALNGANSLDLPFLLRFGLTYNF